jgi:hypothetical protein
MTKQRMKVVYLILATLAICLITPAMGSAQVTVTQVRVTLSNTLSTAVYCDTSAASLPGCNVPLWALPASGVTLTPGQTLVLTQTGLLSQANGTIVGGNFDTSDMVKPTTPTQTSCGPTAAAICTVTIALNTGGGLTVVYTSAGANALNFSNSDNGSATTNEAAPFSVVASFPSFTVSTGYADTEHGPTAGPAACPATGCLPTPFSGAFGTAHATVFIGNPLARPAAPPFFTGTFCQTECYDGGALLITATAPLVTITQGGWGAPAHGHNPGTILNANFAAISPVKIGSASAGCFQLTFTTADAVRAFLPQGGPPSRLLATATNPTNSAAGVFGGQVLALRLNVSMSNVGALPAGLGNFVLTSGPAAGKTVNQVLADANAALGCGTLPSYVTSISGLNDIVDSINNMFD